MIADIIIVLCVVFYTSFCAVRIVKKHRHSKKIGTLHDCSGCLYAGNCNHSCISDNIQDCVSKNAGN